jgi:hypothetical protein
MNSKTLKGRKPKKMKLTQEQRDRCASTATALADAFLWNKSPEGGEYWGGIYKRLMTLAEKGE